MARILFVYHRPASFVQIDRDLLRERWDVRELQQSTPFVNPLAVLRAVRASDLVFGWFAGWHTLWPVTLAWLLRKRSLVVVGGFDVANMPEIGYGFQQGGVRRWVSRWIVRRASRLFTNSFYSQREIERNLGLPRERVAVVYHGLADRFGGVSEQREPRALTVSSVAWISIDRKGLRTFVEAAALVPEISFVLAGEWLDGAIDALREHAPPNVTFTGRLSQDELDTHFRSASVYVQASRHEGFGLALAEAMLAGCVPVVTKAGALPEVAGDVGVQLDGYEASDVADGIRRALALGTDVRRRARERVVTEFPLERRREGLWRLVEELLGA